MAHFDDIYEIAADNYGLVTYAEAKEAGITGGELDRWTSSGRLVRKGRGVYQLARREPTPYDLYAEATALVGPDSVIWGDSVLAMLELAYENPPVVYVSSPRRVRKTLPSWVKLTYGTVANRQIYEGIHCQALPEAIRVCKGHVLPERLLSAIHEAAVRGLITNAEAKMLKEDVHERSQETQQ
jgi:hypothetical protein